MSFTTFTARLNPDTRRAALELERHINANTALIATAAALVMTGTGTPEAAVTAPVGTLFLRTDGGTSTTLYVKETGTGNTGWVAK